MYSETQVLFRQIYCSASVCEVLAFILQIVMYKQVEVNLDK